MANPKPFTAADRLLQDLNAPSFLTQTIPVRLDDNTIDGRTLYGFVATETPGGVTPEYYCGSTNCAATGTTTFAKDVLRAVPFIQPHGFRIGFITFSVTTLQANSSARVGIYSCIDDLNGDIYPNRLLLDGGDVATTSTGTKSTQVALDLEEGRMYWAVYNCTTTGTAPTVASLVVGDQSCLLGGVSGAAPTKTTYLSVASTYGALPTYFPSGATAQTGVAPVVTLVFDRVSAVLRSRTLPGFSPSHNGTMLRSVRLSRGSTLDASSNDRPYAIVKAQARTSRGTHEIVRFDSRKNRLVAGTPYHLSGTIDRPIQTDEEIVVTVEQYGWPKVSMKDTTAFLDIAYTGVR